MKNEGKLDGKNDWKLDENQNDIGLYNIFLRTDFQQGGSAASRNLISDEMQHYDV